MGKFGHLYLWFVIVVAALAGIPRLIASRRFAELQQVRLKGRNSALRSRVMAVVVLVVALLFGSLYFTRWGHEAWVVIAVVFSLLSAAEFYFQAKFTSLEALIFQNRLLGILYLGLSAGSYLLLART